MITIREWRPASDRLTVIRMGLRFIRETPQGRIMGGEPSEIQLSKLIDATQHLGTVLLALDGELVIGFAAAIHVPNPFTGAHYVDEMGIWVEPEHRKTTAGPQLIAALEDWTRQRGPVVLKMAAQPEGIDVALLRRTVRGLARFLLRRGYELAELVFYKRF